MPEQPTPTLPDREQLNDAYEKLSRGFDALERITWQLRRVNEHAEGHLVWPAEVTVDDAYFGLLVRQLHYLELRVESIAENLARFRKQGDWLIANAEDIDFRDGRAESVGVHMERTWGEGDA